MSEKTPATNAVTHLASLRTRGAAKQTPESLFKTPLFDEPITDTKPAVAPILDPERFAQLGIEEIEPYAYNPRTQRNEQYDALKEALSSGGIDGVVLLVTRKPGDTKYHIQAGGNTRLTIIKELWEETGDMRFRAVRCVIKPYVSEESTSAKHIAENLHRSDLCFWDLAVGVTSLRRRIEAAGATLSLRSFIAKAAELGLTLSKTGITYFEFATSTFSKYQFCIKLSRGMVEKLQPFWNRLDRLASIAKIDITPAVHSALTALEEEWMDIHCDAEEIIKNTGLAVGSALHLSAIEFERGLDLVYKDQSVSDWTTFKTRIRTEPLKPGPKPRTNASASGSLTPETLSNDVLPANPTNDVRLTPAGNGVNAEDPAPRLHHPMLATRRPLDIPREGEVTESAAHCWQMALSFATATGQQSLLRRYDRNIGWYVEPYVRTFRDTPPPDYQTGLDIWSMMAMLSGQYDRAVWETMPSDSLWVSVMTNQAPKNMLTAVAVVEPAQVTFARWFFGRAPFGTDDCRYEDLIKNPTGHDLLPHLMHAVHALIRVAPRRFAHINHDGLPKKVFGDIK